jgi:hypothetical protein
MATINNPISVKAVLVVLTLEEKFTLAMSFWLYDWLLIKFL